MRRRSDQLSSSVLLSRLRRALGTDAVRRAGQGYAAGLAAGDPIELETRATEAQARLAAGEVGGRAVLRARRA